MVRVLSPHQSRGAWCRCASCQWQIRLKRPTLPSGEDSHYRNTDPIATREIRTFALKRKVGYEILPTNRTEIQRRDGREDEGNKAAVTERQELNGMDGVEEVGISGLD
jgi:hypothetical protein